MGVGRGGEGGFNAFSFAVRVQPLITPRSFSAALSLNGTEGANRRWRDVTEYIYSSTTCITYIWCVHGGGVCGVSAGHVRDDPGWKLRGLRETSMSEPLHGAHAWLAPSPHLSSRAGKTPGEIRAERRDWRSSRRKRIS